MSAPFSFGFGGNDIETDAGTTVAQNRLPAPEKRCQYGNGVDGDCGCVSIKTCYTTGKEWKESDFARALPSRISFENITIPGGPRINLFEDENNVSVSGDATEAGEIIVPRRAMFDVSVQLKAEENDSNHHSHLLSAMERSDRIPDIYEGGFKTWEGALDLAALVNRVNFLRQGDDWEIVELGAGSGIPTLTAMTRIFEDARVQETGRNSRATFRLKITDFNKEVLMLSSFPNTLLVSEIALAKVRAPSSLGPNRSVDDNGGDSVEIDENFLQRNIDFWASFGDSHRIITDFVSGPWHCANLVEQIRPMSQGDVSAQERGDYSRCHRRKNMLILASETIYDPESMPHFTETLLNLLRSFGRRSKAWVAAKSHYFGPGGTVDAFTRQVEGRGGTVREIWKNDQGVRRAVLEIIVPGLDSLSEASCPVKGAPLVKSV